jgi:hypothetical protein
MKKADIFLIVFYIIVSIGLAFYLSYDSIDYNSKYLIIKVDNEILIKRDLPIKGKEIIPIETEYGINIIEINKSIVKIIESDCYNQICVKDGEIDEVGDVLVCLPHKLIVEIKGNSNSGVDISN